MEKEKVSETIERLIGELPPARQQAARRLLAKLHEENPADMLLFELTLLRLVEVKSEASATPAVPRAAQPPAVDFITTDIEAAKQAILGEIIGVQKSLGKLTRIGEDTEHLRICTDRTESKLDVLRPYRVKVALITLLLTLIVGMVAGWYGRIEYAQYQYETRTRSR